MPPPGQVTPLFLFVLLIFAATLHGLAASGHFPLQRGGAKSRPERMTLFGSIGLTFLALVAGTVAASQLTSWAALIIAGGSSLLFAPLVLRAFPDHLVDSSRALTGFAAATFAAAIILIWLAA
jgi:hypothetical protein